MKKKWTKESFIEAVEAQIANLRDPKLLAARRCVVGARAYNLRARRARTAKAEKVKNAKS